MRLQWKYSLIINLTVIMVLVAFYFFDSIRMRKEMSALHALGAEQGTTLKIIAENTILNAVVGELTTSQAFNAQRLDQIIANLKREHQDMKNVNNVQVTLGDTHVRSSLLAQNNPANFNLDKNEINEIETKGAIIDTITEQSATSIIIKYTVQPKRLEFTQLQSQTSLDAADIPDEFWRMFLSTDFDLPVSTTITVEDKRTEYNYQTALNQGKFPFGLWRMLIANQIYLSPDAIVKLDEENNRWQITDLDSGHNYNLWQDENAFWIHIASADTGYIRVLFAVPYIAKSIRSSLLMHAIFIVIVGVLLVVLIDLMTNNMILKPLARMTEIIQNAETGNFSSYLHKTYASDEISKATRNLVRMFLQLKTSHSRKIDALGQFAAGIAHEIRNPLNSIGMTAQHLKTIFSQPDVSPKDIDEAIELLDIVDEKIEDLKQTSEQFLTLNRPRKLDLTTVNLNELLDSVLSEFVLIAEEANVQINKSYYTELPDLQLDEMLMRQTIFNIVQNSIQAMPKGGSVYITTTVEKIGNMPYILLEIRDTGIGIPEENQELIYDAYFTTKESDGGVGLGLAISHQAITAHQGKVEVKSKVGMGTAFNITLPVNTSENK